MNVDKNSDCSFNNKKKKKSKNSNKTSRSNSISKKLEVEN